MNGLIFAAVWTGLWCLVCDFLRSFGMSWALLTALAGLWGIGGVLIYLS